jgi:hypothetical protein
MLHMQLINQPPPPFWWALQNTITAVRSINFCWPPNRSLGPTRKSRVAVVMGLVGEAKA